MVDGGAFFGLHYKRIVELAAKTRLPAMYVNTRYVEAGGLMTYAEDRLTSSGAPLSTWIRFSRGQNLLTYPWSGPKSLSSSST